MPHETFLGESNLINNSSNSPERFKHRGTSKFSSSAAMAPTKKTKKTADSINSRLALVMKSGKGNAPALQTGCGPAIDMV